MTCSSFLLAQVDWTPIASVAGSVLTAVTAIFALLYQAKQTLISKREDQFNAAISSLGNGAASVRSMAVSTLLWFALKDTPSAQRYFSPTLEALCTVVRFDRDIYFIEFVFKAIERLREANDHAVATALKRLQNQLTRDLLRQIAEYAAGHPDYSAPEIARNLSELAPEGSAQVSYVLNTDAETFRAQLKAAKALPLHQDEGFRRWSVRITALSLGQIERASS